MGSNRAISSIQSTTHTNILSGQPSVKDLQENLQSQRTVLIDIRANRTYTCLHISLTCSAGYQTISSTYTLSLITLS